MIVTFNLTDTAGNSLGIAVDTQYGKAINPKETWRFKAELTNQSVTGYTVESVSGSDIPLNNSVGGDIEPEK